MPGVSRRIYFVLGLMFSGQALGLLRGGWLGHLLAALHLQFTAGRDLLFVFRLALLRRSDSERPT